MVVTLAMFRLFTETLSIGHGANHLRNSGRSLWETHLVKCKICGHQFTPKRFLQKHCDEHSYGELAKFAKDQREVKEAKALAKRHAKEKRDFYDNDITTRRKAAKLACHAYIRKRDEHLPCICCNKPITGQAHAGHFIESGNYPFIRYNEDNIHRQRADCNTFKGGNSGDYEGNLRAKIGDERVDYLLDNKDKPMPKATAQYYKDIELHYKAKLKSISWIMK